MSALDQTRTPEPLCPMSTFPSIAGIRLKIERCLSATFEPFSTRGSLCFRETGFRGQRQMRQNRRRTSDTLSQRPSACRTPRQFGANSQPSGNLSKRGTAWWRTQLQSNPSPLLNSLLTGKSYKSKSARSAHFIGVYYVANYCRRYPVADARRQVYSVVHLGVTSHGNGKSKARQLHFSAGRFGELLRQAPKPYRPHREEFRHGHSAGSRDYSRAIGNRTQGRLACCAAPYGDDLHTGIRAGLAHWPQWRTDIRHGLSLIHI